MSEVNSSLQQFNEVFDKLMSEMSRVIVGQQEVSRFVAYALFSGGHVLLEGAPGVGKTLLVKTLSECLGLSFHRIQFTSDLMPSDITGTQILTEDSSGRKSIEFRKGPVFTQLLLADEINRAGPKTQSALLEAMEEKQVTVLGNTLQLPEPFMVLATQNPVELEGTYPLPEAQLDRFMAKVHVPSPDANELREILRRTTGENVPSAQPLMSPENAAEFIFSVRRLVRQVVVPGTVEEYLVQLLFALSPLNEIAPSVIRKYVRYSPGPRGAQSVLLLSKIIALTEGRVNVAIEDVQRALIPGLRHRLILSFSAEAENVVADDVIKSVAKVA